MHFAGLVNMGAMTSSGHLLHRAKTINLANLLLMECHACIVDCVDLLNLLHHQKNVSNNPICINMTCCMQHQHSVFNSTPSEELHAVCICTTTCGAHIIVYI